MKALVSLARRLSDLYAQGAVRPRIMGRRPLAEGGQAIAALAERRAQGKLVVTMD